MTRRSKSDLRRIEPTLRGPGRAALRNIRYASDQNIGRGSFQRPTSS